MKNRLKFLVFTVIIMLSAAAWSGHLIADNCDSSSVVFQPRRRGRGTPKLPENVRLERDVEYGKGGEKALKLDIVCPKKTPEKPMPVLVFIHGGGWRGGDKASAVQKLVPYAERGYFCVTVNYRLSHEAVFPAQIEDCKCAIRFLRSKAKEYKLDPDRIGVWGSSAGGHLVALLGTSGGIAELEGKGGHAGFSSTVQAVCDWFGPSDLVKIVGGGKHARANNPVELLLGGPVKENIDKAKLASPVTHVDKDDPPFLIMHGDRDRLVPLEQSELLHKKLKEAGVESHLEVLKGAAHGGPQFNDEKIQEMISNFFDRHLGETASGKEEGGPEEKEAGKKKTEEDSSPPENPEKSGETDGSEKGLKKDK